MRSRTQFIAVLVRTAALALLASASVANAHNGKSHIEGTVASIGEKTLVVKQENGRSVSLRLREETSYRLRETGVQATASDLTIGCQVFVESFGMPGAEQNALEVFIATPKSAPPEPATK